MPSSSTVSQQPTEAARLRHRKLRGLRDIGTRVMVSAAGYGVVISLTLIFVFLFIEVAPLLRSANIGEPVSYSTASQSQDSTAKTLYLAKERYQEAAVRFLSDGQVVFFEPTDGKPLSVEEINTDGANITAFGHGEPRTEMAVVGLSDGRMLMVKHHYEITYPEDVRKVTPSLQYPMGAMPQVMDPEGQPLAQIAIQEGERGMTIVAVTADDRMLLKRYSARRSFLTGQTEYTASETELPPPPATVRALLLDITQENLLVVDETNGMHYYNISNPSQSTLLDSASLLSATQKSADVAVSAVSYLLGTVSVIVGRTDGTLSQYMLVRDANNIGRIEYVRSFDSHPAAITTIFPEFSRKGFVVGDASGHLGVHFGTSTNTLLIEPVLDGPIEKVAVAPRNDGVLYTDTDGVIHYRTLQNDHPESSIRSLWRKVWYEGRSGPDYVWQSSSATDEFEPKFSLMPLTLGTLKAAFYAMLFAMPLAIFGAVYTAYFMHPTIRGWVKPVIEVMEALPTVILGFLAGLWFAPFVESHLPAVFSIAVLLPLVMLLTGFGWKLLPGGLRHRVPPGWEAVILVPVIIAAVWTCVALSPSVEVAFFNGSMRQWFTDVGITYDQRNAMVVGVAMGFAVIPTIFSIAEDAVFNVPKHLTQGSLALGATPWQTMLGVVLLTASPGIFSAVMIGFGRAVGETMIVLMATGNSPVMNFNIFEGMRTLSANIAVEMPEAAVGGTHYRILFLAALVLFGFTFVLNTIAEVVRQRLRTRYSSL